MDSAAGSTKEARNRNNQAVFPIKGKIINCLKSDLNKVMSNEVISSMISAFGLVFDGKKIVVDENKLRYGKIIITTDADVSKTAYERLFA